MVFISAGYYLDIVICLVSLFLLHLNLICMSNKNTKVGFRIHEFFFLTMRAFLVVSILLHVMVTELFISRLTCDHPYFCGADFK